MGIVYLVQPCELIGTKRLKVGMSRKNTKERIKKGYRKGTLILSVHNCDNPVIMEKNILKEFNKHFKLIAGKEFFEGDNIEMKNKFDNCMYLYKTEINKNWVNNLIGNIIDKYHKDNYIEKKYNFLQQLKFNLYKHRGEIQNYICLQHMLGDYPIIRYYKYFKKIKHPFYKIKPQNMGYSFIL